mmetsp:Transcript_49605/g.159697  ORF Transcript_49605/g.159697 Transcript_49605/m.159697 type:complete len:248 (+) Transcript_49605:399-1142(+)
MVERAGLMPHIDAQREPLAPRRSGGVCGGPRCVAAVPPPSTPQATRATSEGEGALGGDLRCAAQREGGCDGRVDGRRVFVLHLASAVPGRHLCRERAPLRQLRVVLELVRQGVVEPALAAALGGEQADRPQPRAEHRREPQLRLVVAERVGQLEVALTLVDREGARARHPRHARGEAVDLGLDLDRGAVFGRGLEGRLERSAEVRRELVFDLVHGSAQRGALEELVVLGAVVLGGDRRGVTEQFEGL